MAKIPLPPKKEILEKRSLGMSWQKIADDYNVSNTTALNWGRHYGIDVKHTDPLLQIPSAKAVRDTYEEKGSLLDSGKVFDVSATTFSRWMTHYDIPKKKLGKKTKIPLPPESEFWPVYNNDHIDVVSKKFGVSKSTIHKWRRQFLKG